MSKFKIGEKVRVKDEFRRQAIDSLMFTIVDIDRSGIPYNLVNQAADVYFWKREEEIEYAYPQEETKGAMKKDTIYYILVLLTGFVFGAYLMVIMQAGQCLAK